MPIVLLHPPLLQVFLSLLAKIPLNTFQRVGEGGSWYDNTRLRRRLPNRENTPEDRPLSTHQNIGTFAENVDQFSEVTFLNHHTCWRNCIAEADRIVDGFNEDTP